MATRATVKTYVNNTATTLQLQTVCLAAVDALVEIQAGGLPNAGPCVLALAAAVIAQLNAGAAIIGDGLGG